MLKGVGWVYLDVLFADWIFWECCHYWVNYEQMRRDLCSDKLTDCPGLSANSLLRLLSGFARDLPNSSFFIIVHDLSLALCYPCFMGLGTSCSHVSQVTQKQVKRTLGWHQGHQHWKQICARTIMVPHGWSTLIISHHAWSTPWSSRVPQLCQKCTKQIKRNILMC